MAHGNGDQPVACQEVDFTPLSLLVRCCGRLLGERAGNDDLEWWDGTRSPHTREVQVLGRLSLGSRHLSPLTSVSRSLRNSGHQSYLLPSYIIKMLRASWPCSGAEK